MLLSLPMLGAGGQLRETALLGGPTTGFGGASTTLDEDFESPELDRPQESTGRSASLVGPDAVAASSTSPAAPDAAGETISYDPENATDGANDTAWNAEGDGSGEWILLEYDEPVVVNEVGVLPGYDKFDPEDGTDRFYQLHVVREAEIELSDGTTATARFDREPRIQWTELPPTETTSVRVTIRDTYPPGESPTGESYPYTLDKVGISEIRVEGP